MPLSRNVDAVAAGRESRTPQLRALSPRTDHGALHVAAMRKKKTAARSRGCLCLIRLGFAADCTPHPDA